MEVLSQSIPSWFSQKGEELMLMLIQVGAIVIVTATSIYVMSTPAKDIKHTWVSIVLFITCIIAGYDAMWDAPIFALLLWGIGAAIPILRKLRGSVTKVEEDVSRETV